MKLRGKKETVEGTYALLPPHSHSHQSCYPQTDEVVSGYDCPRVKCGVHHALHSIVSFTLQSPPIPFNFHLISFHIIPSHPTPSPLIESHYISFYPIQSNPISSHLISSSTTYHSLTHPVFYSSHYTGLYRLLRTVQHRDISTSI